MTLVGWGGGSKLTAYDLRLFWGGEARPTAYDLESVGGEGSHTLSHTLLHVWFRYILSTGMCLDPEYREKKLYIDNQAERRVPTACHIQRN